MKMIALIAVLFAPTAVAAYEDAVRDRQSCLSYFADLVRMSEGFQSAARYHERMTAEAADRAQAEKIVASFDSIAATYRQIVDAADRMCRAYD